MVKILEKKSDFNNYFKECCKQKVPCVTIQFNRSTARVRCDFDSCNLKPSEETIQYLIQEQKKLWIRNRDSIDKGQILNYGRYTSTKFNIEVSYEFAKEIDKIMCRAAGVQYREETIDGLPVARVIGKNSYTWTVRCPYCGQKHFHGTREGSRKPIA